MKRIIWWQFSQLCLILYNMTITSIVRCCKLNERGIISWYSQHLICWKVPFRAAYYCNWRYITKSFCEDTDSNRRLKFVWLCMFFIHTQSFLFQLSKFVSRKDIQLTFSIALSLKIIEKSQNRLLFLNERFTFYATSFVLGEFMLLCHMRKGIENMGIMLRVGD